MKNEEWLTPLDYRQFLQQEFYFLHFISADGSVSAEEGHVAAGMHFQETGIKLSVLVLIAMELPILTEEAAIV